MFVSISFGHKLNGHKILYLARKSPFHPLFPKFHLILKDATRLHQRIDPRNKPLSFTTRPQSC